MSRINSVESPRVIFCASDSHSCQTSRKNSGIGMAVLTASITTLAIAKRPKSFSKAILKQGVCFENGVAIVKKTGKKFTGAVSRNTGFLGCKKETTQFTDGIITEKVYHDLFGRELYGRFYKEGKLYLTVGKSRGFSSEKLPKGVYSYTTINDPLDAIHRIKTDSVFEWARNNIKKGTI